MLEINVRPFEGTNLPLPHRSRNGKFGGRQQPRVGNRVRRKCAALQEPLLLAKREVVPLGQRRQNLTG
jgi:hypothetical protein